MRIDLAALARALREEDRQPARPAHRRQADPPALLAARARYDQTRQALERARAGYQAAKQEHLRSKQQLAALRARAGAVSGSTDVERGNGEG